ncbi:hypothetical protein [uncultured Ilyobacter sp.]|jgi:hypothetical protein|uniref:hypothetical protein n=1 Tax=uncultured Ilyobacter sp. TaxID=544433 RepID=UPI0029BFFBA9|nr:hypothetical protein [uncultured Ilyobacter sp.]
MEILIEENVKKYLRRKEKLILEIAYDEPKGCCTPYTPTPQVKIFREYPNKNRYKSFQVEEFTIFIESSLLEEKGFKVYSQVKLPFLPMVIEIEKL